MTTKIRSTFWTGSLVLFIVFAAGCESKMNENAIAEQDATDAMSEAVQATQTFSNPETREAMSLLQSSGDRFVAMVEGLTPEQLAYRESDERWSIAEVAEHLILTENMMQPLYADLLAADTVAMRPDSMMTDETIATMFADRTQKFQAPDAMQPEGKYKTADEILAAWNEARGATEESLSSFSGDLRKHVGENPALGPLDAYQWTQFFANHTDRHLAQMQQVKDHAGYASV